MERLKGISVQNLASLLNDPTHPVEPAVYSAAPAETASWRTSWRFDGDAHVGPVRRRVLIPLRLAVSVAATLGESHAHW